jgi:hypothetical protein
MEKLVANHLGIDPADIIMSRVDSEVVVIVVRQGQKYIVPIADLPKAKPTKPLRKKR